jgi:glycerol-3-phosphate O-acyltransferase
LGDAILGKVVVEIGEAHAACGLTVAYQSGIGCYDQSTMDVERTIEFILDQQAKIAAAHVDLQTDLTDLKGSVGRLALNVERMVTIEEGTLSIVSTLAKRMDELAVSHQRLAEVQVQTEEKLNALISVVDGVIRPQPPTKPS